jgi:hypothetical protein
VREGDPPGPMYLLRSRPRAGLQRHARGGAQSRLLPRTATASANSRCSTNGTACGERGSGVRTASCCCWSPTAVARMREREPGFDAACCASAGRCTRPLAGRAGAAGLRRGTAAGRCPRRARARPPRRQSPTTPPRAGSQAPRAHPALSLRRADRRDGLRRGVLRDGLSPLRPRGQPVAHPRAVPHRQRRHQPEGPVRRRDRTGAAAARSRCRAAPRTDAAAGDLSLGGQPLAGGLRVDRNVHVADPARRACALPRAEFLAKWSGYTALFDYTHAFDQAPESAAGLSWLWPFLRSTAALRLAAGLAALVSVLGCCSRCSPSSWSTRSSSTATSGC